MVPKHLHSLPHTWRLQNYVAYLEKSFQNNIHCRAQHGILILLNYIGLYAVKFI